jgi:hypothetical protein
MVTLSIPLPSAENQSKPMLQYTKQVPDQYAEMKTQYLTILFTMDYGYFYHLEEGNLRKEIPCECRNTGMCLNFGTFQF